MKCIDASEVTLAFISLISLRKHKVRSAQVFVRQKTSEKPERSQNPKKGPNLAINSGEIPMINDEYKTQ